MWLLIAEAFIALGLLVFIVWWTMSGRRRDDGAAIAPPPPGLPVESAAAGTITEAVDQSASDRR